MRHDDPVTLAKYAKENDLLNTPGWKRLKHYVKSAKAMKRNLKQVRIFAARTKLKYKFGVKVPRDEKEAELFDKDNKNNSWGDAISKKLDQVVDEYRTFKDE